MNYPTLQVLGNGWVEKLNPSTNTLFYFNRKTTELTNTRPSLSQTNTLLEFRNNGENGNQRKQGGIDGRDASDDVWMKMYSSDVNKIYYYNKQSKTSVWENPFSDGSNALKHSVPILDSSFNNSSMQINLNEKSIERERKLDEAIERFSVRELSRKSLEKFSKQNEEMVKPALQRLATQNLAAEVNGPVEIHSDVKIEPLKNTIDVDFSNVSEMDIDALDAYAKELEARMSQLKELLQKAKSNPQSSPATNMESTNGLPKVSETNNIPVPDIHIENANESTQELSAKEKLKLKHKQKVQAQKEADAKLHANSQLIFYMDELSRAEEERKALEADQKAKKEAREKYAHIQLLKKGEGDYYKILDLNPDEKEKISSAQIKKAYLKLMIVYHPDKNKRAGSTSVKDSEMLSEKETTERANLVKEAYICLSDPWERYVYDRVGLQNYLLHTKVLQAFKNYILSGVKIWKHGRKDYRIGVGFSKIPFASSMAEYFSFYKPKERWIWMDFNGEYINTGKARILDMTNCSDAEKHSIKGVLISKISDIQKGLASKILKKTGLKSKEHLYFTILTEDRTLDIECESKHQRDFLSARLNLLRVCKQKDHHAFEDHLKRFPFKAKAKNDTNATSEKESNKDKDPANKPNPQKSDQRRRRIVKKSKAATGSNEDIGSEEDNQSNAS